VKKLWIDLETFSTVDLRQATPYRYAEDPRFQILMGAWSNDGKNVHIELGQERVLNIPGLFDRSVKKVAHNAPFERICISRAAGNPVGKYLHAEDWHDTQAIAAEMGYPLGLGKLSWALGADPKDEAGTRLINLFCKPNRKGQRNLPEDHPEEWLDFLFYCQQDVYTLIDVDKRLGGWPTLNEKLAYLADQAINDAGAAIDVDLARRAVEAAESNRMEQEVEISAMTGVDNPGSQPQMMAWCRSVGLKNHDLQKETLAELLAGDLNDDVRRVLELRQELALTASKKFASALGSVSSDGRLRGSFRFLGAHTGRWSGRGTQVQNLPRSQLPTETDTEAAILDLMLGEGGDAYTLRALVRSMFLGPLTVVDYKSIEAIVLAWLAGEEWVLRAFREGRDLYVETANRMSTPDHPLNRSQGKIAVLALGYNGSVGSLRAMGAEGSDSDLEVLVHQWRRANRHTVKLWNTMEKAFRVGGPVGEFMRVERYGKDRAIRLPSGRAIVYRKCSWGDTKASFQDRNGNRASTYGGRLTENVTQAVARDILAEALVRLVDAGYTVVGHVHDEVLVEGDDVDGVKKLMLEPPDWAVGLPIDGEGFVCKRYRKG
jgi:DNA polymerase